MYLLVTLGIHRSYGNGDINSYINSHMNTLEKNWIHRVGQQYEEIFKIRNTNLQLRSPGHGGQKNKKAGNCKEFCVSRQRNHQISPCKPGFTGSNKLNKKTKQIIQLLLCKTNSSYKKLLLRFNAGVRIEYCFGWMDRSHPRWSIKKLFLKMLQYSQENTFVGASS